MENTGNVNSYVDGLIETIESLQGDVDKLTKALNSCVSSMMAHPDNQPDSEFSGFIDNAIEALNNK